MTFYNATAYPSTKQHSIGKLTYKLEQFNKYDTITIVMENNNDSVNKTTPENNGIYPYLASESIINPQSTEKINSSQSIENPTITPSPTSQSIENPTITPSPTSQQQITSNTTTVPVNVNTAKNTISPPIDSNLPPDVSKKKPKIKKIITTVLAVLLFGAAISGSYLYGRSNEKIIIQEPDLKPINLPPQAVVLNECAPGRGKQYILPKDIPVGPIYSVVNSKVIAIEYSLDLLKLLDGSDVFSDTILSLVNEYPTNHLSIIPDNPNPALLKRVQLIMFVVPKEEANKITCV